VNLRRLYQRAGSQDEPDFAKPRENALVAYVIADVDVTDPVRYDNYRKLTPGAIAPYGGRFVVRGGEVAPLEGGWTPSRIVVIEFPSLEAARRFYDSPEYREARDARAGAANMRMIAVQGI
jgi:uncharacterized protein (DUF1330 family)